MEELRLVYSGEGLSEEGFSSVGSTLFGKEYQYQYRFGQGTCEVFEIDSVAIIYIADEENCFKTISNFKECIIRGGEPVFFWKGLQYGVCFYGDKYCIALTNGEQEKICDTPDDVLNYYVGEDRLRDVITQVTVLHRNI